MPMSRPSLADPRVAVDAAVVVVVAVLSVVDVAAQTDLARPGDRPADALAYGLVVAGSLSLYWRRRAPVVVLGFVTAVVIAMYLREYGAFLAVLGLSALYAVAAHEEDRRRAWVAMITAGVALMLAAGV